MHDQWQPNSNRYSARYSRQSKRKTSCDHEWLLDEENDSFMPARKQLISEDKISANLRNLRLESNANTKITAFPITSTSEISNANINPGLISSISCNSDPIDLNWHLNIERKGYDGAISVNRCQIDDEMDDGTCDVDEPNHSMKVTSHVLIKDFHESFEDDSISDEEIDRNRNSEIIVDCEVLERFPSSQNLLKDLLPQILMDKYNKPCMELVPYVPHAEFIHGVLKKSHEISQPYHKTDGDNDSNEYCTSMDTVIETSPGLNVPIGNDGELDDYDDLMDANYMDFT